MYSEVFSGLPVQDDRHICGEARQSQRTTAPRQSLPKLLLSKTALGLLVAALQFLFPSAQAATIDVFAGPVLWSDAGSVSVFDRNRQVLTRLSENDELVIGIRFGFPLNKRLALELILRGFTNDYNVTVFDRRRDDQPDFEVGIVGEELPQVMLDICYRPLAARISPYTAVGIGYLGVDPELDSRSPAFNVATGVTAYATSWIGIRLDLRFTYSKVDGLAAQSSPPRELPYSDELKFTEVTVGLIFNIQRHLR